MIKRAILTLFFLVVFLMAVGNCQTVDSSIVRQTSPRGALFRSAFVPGWGQLYNGKYLKAGIFFIGESWLAYGIYKDWKDADEHERNFKSSFDDPDYQAEEFRKYEDSRDSRNLKMWILAATIFYSMFDAYVDAQLADFDQTDKSFEVYIGPGEKEEIRISLAFNFP